jgi:hypothetical protein
MYIYSTITSLSLSCVSSSLSSLTSLTSLAHDRTLARSTSLLSADRKRRIFSVDVTTSPSRSSSREVRTRGVVVSVAGSLAAPAPIAAPQVRRFPHRAHGPCSGINRLDHDNASSPARSKK